MKKIRVAELFAGVGGFRLGLEGWKGKSAGSGYKKKLNSRYSVVWSNQWEPSTKVQHASAIYEARFGKAGHSNVDIAKVTIDEIPDHDVLCGGFPCQDYSVATTLRSSGGLLGKKGVLWWQIERIIRQKQELGAAPKVVFLENVDRLLKSPADQRGKDFGIMLASLNDLGYVVEWRVVNAAEYGMPQRRRRVFILAYRADVATKLGIDANDLASWVHNDGILMSAFPATEDPRKTPVNDIISGDLEEISDLFGEQFLNSGICMDRRYYSAELKPVFHGYKTVLWDVLDTESAIDEDYLVAQIPDLDSERAKDATLSTHWNQFPGLRKWMEDKGAKKKIKTNREGIRYTFSEGGMVFPDPVTEPSRTIITSEGGKTPSRFKHVVQVGDALRRLYPIELERLNMFPDNHTAGLPDAKRAFMMGNALVVGVVERIGLKLAESGIFEE